MANDAHQTKNSIDEANCLTLREFCQKFLPELMKEFVVDLNATLKEGYQIQFTTACDINDKDLKACFNLIEMTSKEDYKSSSIGWSPTKKRAEMKLLDMKYLLLTTKEASNDYDIEGFLSFMLTYEDAIPVVYCYEVHLERRLQGRGVGSKLMSMMEGVGRQAGMKKSMLTVFVRNAEVRAWYERRGYKIDEFSPGPMRLRGGKVKEPDYVILSKPLNGEESSNF